MRDFDFDPVEEDTNRYLKECSDAQEQMEADEEEVESYCCECFICHHKILPRETAVTYDGGDTWFHDSHLEEASGEELAIDNGCDYDTMSRYMEAML